MRPAVKNTVVLDMAEYMITNGATIRKCAEEYDVSKSYVHYLMHKSLPNISLVMYKELLRVFAYNTEQRASRGGKAKVLKYGSIRGKR